MPKIVITVTLEYPPGVNVQVGQTPDNPGHGKPPESPEDEVYRRALRGLKKLGVRGPADILARFPPDRVLDVCIYVHNNRERIQKPGAYVNRMLRQGWAVPKGNEGPKVKGGGA
jgi:hypothetical protein